MEPLRPEGPQPELKIPKLDRAHAALPFKEVDLNQIGELNSERGLAVISNARKFILPIPNLGPEAEPLRYPEGHAQAGTPICDWQGNPKPGSGLVFFNAKDSCWQAVQADGQGVIIINGVSELKAEALYAKIDLLGGDPLSFKLEHIKEFLEFAGGNGLSDIYDSHTDFIRKAMTPARAADQECYSKCFGFMKRDDRDTSYAVRIEGALELKGGPSATPQLFENGAVVVQNGGSRHGVQPAIFLRDYRHIDGRSINSLDEVLRLEV